MTDVHCHVSAGDPSVREFLIGREFVGVHPWEAETADPAAVCATLRAALASGSAKGIGEIGLDRLHARTISDKMWALYEAQLALAFEFDCPIVLHGAKCWGQTLAVLWGQTPSTVWGQTPSVRGQTPQLWGQAPKTVLKKCGKAEETNRYRKIRFLCHGFSRSGGLIPEIARRGGFISVGTTVLNDHAVNYRYLVREIPDKCLLIETDRNGEGGQAPGVWGQTPGVRGQTPGQTIREVLEKTAEIRGVSPDVLEALTDANATRFLYGDEGE